MDSLCGRGVQVWENGVVYHKHVVKFAKHVSERMNELSPTG